MAKGKKGGRNNTSLILYRIFAELFLLLNMENNLFSKTLFWDVNVLQMDLQRSKFYIIERIVTRGNYKDWKTMLSIYAEQEIKDCIIRIKELDAKTLHFCSFYFDIPKEAFECYLKPSWTEVPTSY